MENEYKYFNSCPRLLGFDIETFTIPFTSPEGGIDYYFLSIKKIPVNSPENEYGFLYYNIITVNLSFDSPVRTTCFSLFFVYTNGILSDPLRIHSVSM
jgi:hypothetical protein